MSIKIIFMGTPDFAVPILEVYKIKYKFRSVIHTTTKKISEVKK